jgi:hypothetical protein
MTKGERHAGDESPEDLPRQRDREDGEGGQRLRSERGDCPGVRRARPGRPRVQASGGEASREGSGRPFGQDRPLWFPDWRGETVVIVGSGPSAAHARVEQAKGKARVICINESWRLAPWADVLYGCDGIWWRKSKGVPNFQGLKLCQDGNACHDFPALLKVRVRHRVNEILTEKPGEIGWGGMRLDRGVHWHGAHRAGLNNPREANMARWRASVNGAAQRLAELGITVINASLDSALTAYPKMPLQEALEA